MRPDFNEERERSLAHIRERIHSMDFSKLDPVVHVYQTGPTHVRIVCEQDLFVCDVEMKGLSNEMTNELGVMLVYKPYINGVAEDEYQSSYKSSMSFSFSTVGKLTPMEHIEFDIKNDITRFAYSYYEMYRSSIEAAVKLKRLTEVSKRARMNFAPEVEPIERRAM